jgi:predicted XRE-type DNA-binding protein
MERGCSKHPYMTPAELRAWIKQRRLSHDEAAELLAMSRPGLRKNIYGVTPIGAQTELIIGLIEIIEKGPQNDRN